MNAKCLPDNEAVDEFGDSLDIMGFDVVRLISLLIKSFPDAATIFFGKEPINNILSYNCGYGFTIGVSYTSSK